MPYGDGEGCGNVWVVVMGSVGVGELGRWNEVYARGSEVKGDWGVGEERKRKNTNSGKAAAGCNDIMRGWGSV